MLYAFFWAIPWRLNSEKKAHIIIIIIIIILCGSDSLPAATAQYQHVAITLRSRQLLKMGTQLPETC